MADTELKYRLTLEDYSFNKGLKGASDQTKRLDNQFTGIYKSLNRIRATLNAIGAAFAISAIKNFGSAIIDSLKNYEYFSASLRTLLYGDRMTAKALEGQLISLAAKTPFSLTDVQEGSKQLLAYGFRPGAITKDLKMLGDVASGVGAPLNDIIYLYGTLKTQGRAYTRDIMQFTSRGIPIIGKLAEQFKVSEDKIKGMVEEGKIGFPQIEKAFKSMTSAGGQFFGMMDEQSKTVGGKLSNLGDSWEQLKVNIGKSQTGIINATVSWASELVSRINSVIAAENQLTDTLQKSGNKQLSFWEKRAALGGGFRGTLLNFVSQGLFGVNYSKTLESVLLGTQNRYNKGIAEATAGDDVQQKNARLNALMKIADLEINSLYKDGATKSSRELNLRLAVLQAAKESIKGNLNLLATEGKVKGGDVAPPLGSSVQEYQGAKALNVNITVNELGKIEQLNVNEMQDVNQLHTDWRKHLLELLNDSNQIANR